MIIQKFGGVAMKNEEMRLNCINHIKDGLNEFGDVVVVVSAIGRYGGSVFHGQPSSAHGRSFIFGTASDLAVSCGELIAQQLCLLN